MGTHGRAKTRYWVGPSRAVALAGALGAGVLGVVTVPLAGHAAAAPSSAAAPDSRAPALVDGTPCTVTAKACADLASNHAWLIKDGQVTRGPVLITQGAQDGENTPTGTFGVLRKDKDHRSAEFDNAPMPYSVFFAPGGIAFHEGSLQKQSAGCVHLSHDDAVAWFDYLQVGDEVQVH